MEEVECRLPICKGVVLLAWKDVLVQVHKVLLDHMDHPMELLMVLQDLMARIMDHLMGLLMALHTTAPMDLAMAYHMECPMDRHTVIMVDHPARLIWADRPGQII